MILIGQFDSSYVRRVGIALTLYGLPFEHRPWSTFGEADKIRPYSPLVRVPVLVLDDGEALVETFAILDHVDSLVPPEEALIPRHGAPRRAALRIMALASGITDMFVSLFYELHLHKATSDLLVTRRKRQITDALAVLERDRAARSGAFWFGERLGHADIAVAAMLRHVTEALPDLVDSGDFPALFAHSRALEALPAFKAISQRFIPPA